MHIFLVFFALREVSLHRKTGGSEIHGASVRKACTGCFFFFYLLSIPEICDEHICADSGPAGGTRPGRSTACVCGLISFKLLRDVRVAVRAAFLSSGDTIPTLAESEKCRLCCTSSVCINIQSMSCGDECALIF